MSWRAGGGGGRAGQRGIETDPLVAGWGVSRGKAGAGGADRYGVFGGESRADPAAAEGDGNEEFAVREAGGAERQGRGALVAAGVGRGNRVRRVDGGRATAPGQFQGAEGRQAGGRNRAGDRRTRR